MRPVGLGIHGSVHPNAPPQSLWDVHATDGACDRCNAATPCSGEASQSEEDRCISIRPSTWPDRRLESVLGRLARVIIFHTVLMKKLVECLGTVAKLGVNASAFTPWTDGQLRCVTHVGQSK